MANLDAIICAYTCRSETWQGKFDSHSCCRRARYVPCPSIKTSYFITFAAASSTQPEKTKRKKEKKGRKDAEPDPISVTDSRKAKKRKRKHEQLPDEAAVPPASPKRQRVTISPAEGESYLKAHNITVHLPPGTSALLPITSFDALPIPDSLRGAFSSFKEPTPIQSCAWPPALSGKDVVGIAETGSGKTLAFGIPALARLLTSPGSVAGNSPRALVVAPTRELALQTYDALSALDAVKCVAVFGGIDKAQQARTINQGAQVVVGTPGRILDLINDGALALEGVDYLVLDEADRMLDKGFENDIRSIIGHTVQGAARQTLMCTSIHAFTSDTDFERNTVSATWPEAVRRLAASFLHDPVRITVGSDDLTANSRVAQGMSFRLTCCRLLRIPRN
jgi:ATP-dependent RNA helicase DBP3